MLKQLADGKLVLVIEVDHRNCLFAFGYVVICYTLTRAAISSFDFFLELL